MVDSEDILSDDTQQPEPKTSKTQVLQQGPRKINLGDYKPLGDRTKDLKVGDVVLRSFGVGGPMELKVTEVDDKFIHCGGWKFLKETGGEVDEMCDSDGKTSVLSFLVEKVG